jgi:glycosyltransferase involved in cell wall biosynthesis
MSEPLEHAEQHGRPRVLILTDYYLPGYRGGGPIRTISHLVERLGHAVEFMIITGDRDLGDEGPYGGITTDTWVPVGAAQVLYASPPYRRLKPLRRLVASTAHDVLFLSGLFSRTSIRLLVLRRARLLPRRPTIIAARGELSPGALRLKSVRKYLFLFTAKLFRLFDGVIWHASSDLERDEILRGLKTRRACVLVAMDLHSGATPSAPARWRAKAPGSARIVFVSRVVRKKNLDFAISILKTISGSVEFDIYGPIEDGGYWIQCQAAMATMPPNVRATYCGEVKPSAVIELFSRYDLFLFPTLSENFGYVILEALVAGCPIVLSDATPWRDLAYHNAGWDLPLSEPERFTMAVQQVVDMDQAAHARLREGARRLGEFVAGDERPVAANRNLFTQALRHSG